MAEIDKNLFWDVDFKKLDYEENASFIIKRVLLFGDKKNYDILKKRYSCEEMKKAASKISYPDKKTLIFGALYLICQMIKNVRKSYQCKNKARFGIVR